MRFRAWVCLAAAGLAACGGTPTPDGGTGGASGGGDGMTGGGGGTAGINDTCQTAEVIPGAGTYTGTTKGAARDYKPDCTGYVNEAEDVVFSLAVPAGHRVKLGVSSISTEGHSFDPSLYILGDCGAADVACLAGVDASEGGQESLEWLNDAATERTVFVVVDSYRARVQAGADGGDGKGTSGDFILEVSFEPLTAGDACGSATPLQPGTPLAAQELIGFSGDYPGSMSCANDVGPDRAFKITVPAGNLVTVAAQGAGGLDAMLSAATSAASCGVTCVANADATGNNGAETLSWKNATAAPVELFIVVDAYGDTIGPFSISATLSNPGADDVCEGATVLTDGANLAHTTVGFSNDYALQNGYVGCASSGYQGPDRAYAFVVPPSQRGRVTVTPADGGLNPSLNLLNGAMAACNVSPRVCSTGTNVGPAGQPEALTVFNTGAAALNYFAIVDSTVTSGIDYVIDYALDTPAADDTCTTNQSSLPDAGTINGSLAGFVGDYGGVGTGCFQAGGADRVYRARVGAGEKLTATLVPDAADGGFDGVVNFIVGTAATCEALPRTCAGGFDFTVRNQVEKGGFVNTSAAPVDVFMVVADYEKDSTDTNFTLTTEIGPIPPGETCDAPIVTTAQTINTTLVGSTNDTSVASNATGCVIANSLPDVVYELEVPAGKKLVAIATPQTGTDIAMNLVDGACRNITACLANANTGAASAAETLEWTNSASVSKTVKLIVVGVPPGSFALDLRIP